MTPVKPVILCVDDEKVNLRLLESILAPRGYEVVAVSNGKTAIQKIKTRKIDLVLLDIMMPEMDGYEVCREIKAHKKLRNIPVIMITGLTTKQDRVKGIEAGAEEFLSKPFDQTEVMARIKMLLKVKELNDKLNYAYDNISRLANIGQDIINTFNPLEFDFMSKIDALVGQIIRHSPDMADRPEIVLVRMLTAKNNFAWYRYEFAGDKLERAGFDINLAVKLPKTENSRLFFYNEAVMEGTMFQSFRDKLRAYSIIPRNMVCYMSNSLSVFALNYNRDVLSYDAAVLNSIVMQTLFLRSLASQVMETEDAFQYTVHSLARASEATDEDTGKHIFRVGLYCALLAKRLNCPESFVRDIRIQAALHDVGNLHISSTILKKPGELVPEEWTEIRKHCIAGAKIIGNHPRLELARSIALTHHERYDGSGYPNRMYGDDIPLEGMIMAIADNYDAIRNARLYKSAVDHKTTVKILTKGDGRTMPEHFAPPVLKAFVDLSSKFGEIYEAVKEEK